jgi:hypothetical protein
MLRWTELYAAPGFPGSTAHPERNVRRVSPGGLRAHDRLVRQPGGVTSQPEPAAENGEKREDVEGSNAEGMADSPGERSLKAGLSEILGGWSGGTLASTSLSLADFSRLSRGRTIQVFVSPGCGPGPRRRSARRHPAPKAPWATWAMAREPPGAKTAPLTTESQCNSGTSSGAAAPRAVIPGLRAAWRPGESRHTGRGRP